MTKRQRAQVVELLRCAADLAVCGDRCSALDSAARHLELQMLPSLCPPLRDGHWSELIRSPGPIRDSIDHRWEICGPGYEFCLLEAAQRVEEGSWP